MKRQLNEVQKDPTVSHRAQLTTVFLSFWGLLYICLEVSLCFPQPPHMQWGSSDAGEEQGKSLGDVVGFRASIHFGYECNLSRISPGLASPLSFHVEAHVSLCTNYSTLGAKHTGNP